MSTDTLQGAAAGVLATVPMTAFMEWGFQQLPHEQQAPLPPRQITEHLAEAVDARQHLSDQDELVATIFAHFAYGAACGVAYNLMTPPAARGPATGVAYGLGVWTASYLGLLPALRLLPSATSHPWQRNALMIAAHIVWGTTLGWSASQQGRSTD